MNIIALGSADKHIHNFRTNTLFECLTKTFANENISLICSGWKSGDKTLSEAEIMKEKLIKKRILEICPNLEIFTEEYSTDTAKNIRNSLQFMEDKNILHSDEPIYVFTSDFHIQRTKEFVDYIIKTEFPHLLHLDAKMLSAENYALASHHRHLFSHPTWLEKHNFLSEMEQRWLQIPVSQRERNKPQHISYSEMAL